MKQRPSHVIDCRLATLKDAPRLAEMSRDYIETGLGWSWRAERIARFITAGESVVLCAIDGDGSPPIGFAVMEFHAEHAHLNLLAVDPDYRRRGVAARLLAWLEKTALIAGISTVILEVRSNNDGARRFYAERGYEQKVLLPRYYQGRESAYRLIKRLRPDFGSRA
ncbi:MAG: GNAT family N-acetyltransferase [Pseudomonadota bacterium]